MTSGFVQNPIVDVKLRPESNCRTPSISLRLDNFSSTR